MTEIGMIRDSDEMRRHALAHALSAAGYPTAPATLATMATRGGGPPYRLYGRIPLYRWGDALAWAESRLSAPRLSTSEGDALPAPKRGRRPPSKLDTRASARPSKALKADDAAA